ncbi:MAG: hypothetical protein QM704_04620 [Anaeromyxobacteraceae bacterium]
MRVRHLAPSLAFLAGVTCAAPSRAGSPAPTVAVASWCTVGPGKHQRCLVGRFARGLPVRVLTEAPGCRPRTSVPAIFVHGGDGPETQAELRAWLARGEAIPATLLEGAEACGQATLALVGTRQAVEPIPRVPVEEPERSDVAARAATSEAAREVIRSDPNNAARVPDRAPAEVFTFGGRGPMYVQLRSRSEGVVQEGPVVVVDGARIVGPFQLCTTVLDAYRLGARLLVQANTGGCDAGGIRVTLHEWRDGALVPLFSSTDLAN